MNISDSKERVTDWDSYYKKKKSFFSHYTQKKTLEYIMYYIEKSFPSANIPCISIVELGGGNSCFAKNICERRKVSQYSIVDNNSFSVNLFNDAQITADSHSGVIRDLTKEYKGSGKYDFVFSIGLIEHFDRCERSNVIKNHFVESRSGGYVLISFPSPTIKYRFFRKLLELLRLWQFWDETPFFFDEIESELKKYGDVEDVVINKRIFLTQTLVLIKTI